MLRHLSQEQPQSFKFTEKNRVWIDAQIKKYPPGRQASAVIPVLWRAQEQEGWLSKPAIECVSKLLGMPPIRVLEIASFYFMFHLKPVGDVAHFQICGTTPCMLRSSEALIALCKKKISKNPNTPSKDGKLSWEEVECLGACANAPVAQIGKDYYEDLSVEKLDQLIKDFVSDKVPVPGSQVGRFSSEPHGDLTSLVGPKSSELNASVSRAVQFKDTIKRVTGR